MDINEMIQKIKKPALLFELNFEEFTSPNLNSHIGGMPYLKKEDDYPVCNLCNKPLNFIFQLRIPKENDIFLYVFYYCNSCIKSSGDKGFFIKEYVNPKVSDMRNKVENPLPVRYGDLCFTPSWMLPSWNALFHLDLKYIDYLNDEFGQQAADEYELIREEILDDINFEPFNIYKGYPNFLNEPHLPLCDCCRKQMDLWFQIDTHEEFGLVWKGFGCLYIFKCQKEEKFKILIQS